MRRHGVVRPSAAAVLVAAFAWVVAAAGTAFAQQPSGFVLEHADLASCADPLAADASQDVPADGSVYATPFVLPIHLDPGGGADPLDAILADPDAELFAVADPSGDGVMRTEPAEGEEEAQVADEPFGDVAVAAAGLVSLDDDAATLFHGAAIQHATSTSGVDDTVRDYLFVTVGTFAEQPDFRSRQFSLTFTDPAHPTYDGRDRPNQGSNRSVDLTRFDDTDTTTSYAHVDGSFEEVPTNAFGVITPTTMSLFVPVTELPDPTDTVTLWAYGGGFLYDSVDVTADGTAVSLAVTDEEPAADCPGEAPGDAVTPADAATDVATAGSDVATEDDGGSLVPLLIAVTAVVLVGGFVAVGRGSGGSDEDDDGTTPPPIATPPTEDACRCDVTVVMEGPQSLALCCGPEQGRLRARGNPDEGTGIDPFSRHLDVDWAAGHHEEGVWLSGDTGGGVPDAPGRGVDMNANWDLFDTLIRARVTADCTNATLDLAEAETTWTVDVDEASITVSFEGTVPMRCESGRTEIVEIAGTHRIAVERVRPRVGIAIQIVPWYDTSHVDVILDCGDYLHVFGYYPEPGTPQIVAATTEVPGYVKRTRNVEPRIGIHGSDDAGRPLTRSVRVRSQQQTFADRFVKDSTPLPYRIHWLDVDCSQFHRVRWYWEMLSRLPGDYSLLVNNCAAHARNSLVYAGLWQGDLDAYRPGLVDAEVEKIASSTERIH